jgi:mono/diheme cytochrome c family protein
MACTAAFLLHMSTAAAQPTPASGGGLDGETLFATTCGWCHADGGREAGKGPKLAASQRSDEFIVQRIKHGKEGAMPAFDRTYNDEQIAEIVKYIRSLKDDAG